MQTDLKKARDDVQELLNLMRRTAHSNQGAVHRLDSPSRHTEVEITDVEVHANASTKEFSSPTLHPGSSFFWLIHSVIPLQVLPHDIAMTLK